MVSEDPASVTVSNPLLDFCRPTAMRPAPTFVSTSWEVACWIVSVELFPPTPTNTPPLFMPALLVWTTVLAPVMTTSLLSLKDSLPNK